MKNKSNYIQAAVWGILFILWIAIVKLIDVAPIGPEGTSVGLSHLNSAVRSSFGDGINLFWYNLTEGLGIVAILICAVFACMGVVQLIKGKSIKSVDRIILALGGLYAVTVIFYVLFDKIVINYRPIMAPGETELEASFPSSHTVLACVVLGSLFLTSAHFIKNEKLAVIVRILSIALMILTIYGRLAGGEHWFTDIVGGVLLSVALLELFFGIAEDYC